MSEVEIESRKHLTKQVRKLENQIKRLEKERDICRRRYDKQYAFESAFRRFYNRFRNRKYDSDYPIERFIEIIDYLFEILNR